MSRKRCECGMIHFSDEPCPSCSGAIAPPGSYDAPKHIPYTGPLPSLDPYVQEFREKYGRRLQEDLYPETDDITGGLRR